MKKDVQMPIERLPLAMRYAVFAVFSTAVNWAIQLLVLRTVAGHFAIYVALFMGTGGGFFVKYILDKHFIFYQFSSDGLQEFWIIALYLLTSVMMTAFYLISQALIYFVYGVGIVYYISGTFVLLLGYTMKFVLDGRFVFKTIVAQEFGVVDPCRPNPRCGLPPA